MRTYRKFVKKSLASCLAFRDWMMKSHSKPCLDFLIRYSIKYFLMLIFFDATGSGFNHLQRLPPQKERSKIIQIFDRYRSTSFSRFQHIPRWCTPDSEILFFPNITRVFEDHSLAFSPISPGDRGIIEHQSPGEKFRYLVSSSSRCFHKVSEWLSCFHSNFSCTFRFPSLRVWPSSRRLDTPNSWGRSENSQLRTHLFPLPTFQFGAETPFVDDPGKNVREAI